MKPLDPREPKFTPHVVAGPDAHWPKSLTAMARVPAEDELALSLVDAGAEIDRLQRRVVELEGEVSEQSHILEDAGRFWKVEATTAQKYLEAESARLDQRITDLGAEAAEQRKRAEELQSRLNDTIEAAEGSIRRAWATAEEVRSEHAAAIEKARQDAFDLAADVVRECLTTGLLTAGNVAQACAAIRRLKSTKEPNP